MHLPDIAFDKTKHFYLYLAVSCVTVPTPNTIKLALRTFKDGTPH